MLKGLFPGTFDPPTKGHFHLIFRAASICDHLVVGIGHNSAKHPPLLRVEERIEVMREETKAIKNVEIATFTGLTVNFARSIGVDILIRGLRSEADFDYEKQMGGANFSMGIETVFLIADPKVGQISSTLIRELAAQGASLRELIPEGLTERLQSRMQERN